MKIRTINKAYEEIKKMDPDSCVSKHFIRQLIVNGIIPYKKSGSKYLFDLEDLEKYLKDSSR